jgi:hypothetical protein
MPQKIVDLINYIVSYSVIVNINESDPINICRKWHRWMAQTL